MNDHDLIESAARNRFPLSDAEFAAETDTEDGWFMPVMFIAFMLLLFGSAYLSRS